MTAALKQINPVSMINEVIIKSISSTLTKYCRFETSYGIPFLDNAHTNDIRIAGFLRLKGSNFSHELLLGFSKELFVFIYNNATQAEILEVTRDELDFAGELLNVSFGVIDNALRPLGISLEAEFPKVLIEEELEQVLATLPPQALRVPLESAGKKYWLLIFQRDN